MPARGSQECGSKDVFFASLRGERVCLFLPQHGALAIATPPQPWSDVIDSP
jgi:hypothetical protein